MRKQHITVTIKAAPTISRVHNQHMARKCSGVLEPARRRRVRRRKERWVMIGNTKASAIRDPGVDQRLHSTPCYRSLPTVPCQHVRTGMQRDACWGVATCIHSIVGANRHL